MSDPINNGGRGWIAVLGGAILAIVVIFLLTSSRLERTGNIDVAVDMPKVDAPAVPSAPAAPAAPEAGG